VMYTVCMNAVHALVPVLMLLFRREIFESTGKDLMFC